MSGGRVDDDSDGHGPRLSFGQRFLAALPRLGRNGEKQPLVDRFKEAVVKPVEPSAAAKAKADDVPLSVEELRDAVAFADDKERLTGLLLAPVAAAIALLVGGEVALSKGIGHLAWGSGTSLVLAATLLWALEVVVAKRLLSGIAPATVSLVRMGVGSAALLAYLAVEGSLGSLFALNRSQLGWVLFTGLLLAGYVGTWMTALSRARAIDVTSILVASSLITAALQALAGAQPLAPEWLGLVLITVGTALVAWRMPRHVMAT